MHLYILCNSSILMSNLRNRRLAAQVSDFVHFMGLNTYIQFSSYQIFYLAKTVEKMTTKTKQLTPLSSLTIDLLSLWLSAVLKTL